MAEPLQIDGIAIHIEGPPEAADTVVMIHGWPDTHRLWDRTVAALKDQHRRRGGSRHHDPRHQNAAGQPERRRYRRG